MRVSLVNVWYSYGSGGWALRGVTLEFESRRALAVVGPNGSGKTTMLKVSSLLYRPVRGEVRVDGRPGWVGGRRTDARRRLVYVHEAPILVRGTALYNVAYGLVLRGVPAGEAEEEAAKVMEILGIERLASKDRRELSSGEAQLVCIARAIALRPEILFLDEPTAHLDVEKRVVVRDALRELVSGGMGCVIATHDYLFASSAADSYVLLDGGRLVERGDSEDLLERLTGSRRSP